MTALSYHPDILWHDDQMVITLPFKDTENLFVGDPISWNSTGAEACDAGTTDDVTFVGLCLSKLATGLHSSTDLVAVALLCKARVTLSTAAAVSPGQGFIFGNDGRGTMQTIGSAAGQYGWGFEYQASSVSTAIILFNVMLLSPVTTHLFEDAST